MTRFGSMLTQGKNYDHICYVSAPDWLRKETMENWVFACIQVIAPFPD